MLVVDAKACTGCKLCERNCPFSAMMVVDGTARALDNCTLCGACMNVCSVNAISIERAAVSPEELAAYQGVAVWAECEEAGGGKSLAPKRVALELLGIGRELAERIGQPLIAFAAGDERPIDVDTLIAHGADTVIRHQNKLLWPYSTDAYATVISAMVAARKPNIFLLGATTNGRDLAPRVAARLKLGLTADCTRLKINEDGQLVQTRPAFGGQHHGLDPDAVFAPADGHRAAQGLPGGRREGRTHRRGRGFRRGAAARRGAHQAARHRGDGGQ